MLLLNQVEKTFELFFHQAHQSGDQPPSLSTDEESGSSTSSCDEDMNLQTNATASGSSSPSRRNHVDRQIGKWWF